MEAEEAEEALASDLEPEQFKWEADGRPEGKLWWAEREAADNRRTDVTQGIPEEGMPGGLAACRAPS